MKKIISLAIVLAMVLAPAAFGQLATNDVFDRANGTNLGVDWIEDDALLGTVSRAVQPYEQFQINRVFNAAHASPSTVAVRRGTSSRSPSDPTRVGSWSAGAGRAASAPRTPRAARR